MSVEQFVIFSQILWRKCLRLERRQSASAQRPYRFCVLVRMRSCGAPANIQKISGAHTAPGAT